MASASAAVKAVKHLAPTLGASGASRIGSRALHAGGIKQTSEHGGSYGADYLHAEHMYNIPAMSHRKLKFGLGVFGALAIGIGVPIFAVVFQQKKQSAG
ncbi:hypothetical protein O6H91_03G021700 [Diphasiastrum complanatum]|uniref:Uncharacterized protein n=1 Tax=Diphasiastrum complanatum TaxID=34168 RepID=A0ACC2E424_DIPCM|nr:hypothetical protein O6H91_03G021700 [Diphasiastrum complanatum]